MVVTLLCTGEEGKIGWVVSPPSKGADRYLKGSSKESCQIDCLIGIQLAGRLALALKIGRPLAEEQSHVGYRYLFVAEPEVVVRHFDEALYHIGKWCAPPRR